MQNPNEDTQWNDALRRHGILAENSKEGEVTEDQLINLLEETVQKKTGNVVKAYEDMTLDELEELEDEEDERVLLQYRSEKSFTLSFQARIQDKVVTDFRDNECLLEGVQGRAPLGNVLDFFYSLTSLFGVSQ